MVVEYLSDAAWHAFVLPGQSRVVYKNNLDYDEK